MDPEKSPPKRSWLYENVEKVTLAVFLFLILAGLVYPPIWLVACAFIVALPPEYDPAIRLKEWLERRR